jgi:hypothetical protein
MQKNAVDVHVYKRRAKCHEPNSLGEFVKKCIC